MWMMLVWLSAAHGAGFAVEALQHLLVLDHLRLSILTATSRSSISVEGAIDRAHAAGGDDRAQFELPQRMGMMTGWPHLVQGVGLRGAPSVASHWLALHRPHTAKRNGFFDWLVESVTAGKITELRRRTSGEVIWSVQNPSEPTRCLEISA